MSMWGIGTRRIAEGIGAGIGAATLALVTVAGCGTPPTEAAGTAALTSENRTIANITGLELATSGQVEITNGDTQALSIEAPADVLPVLTSEVNGGVLRLSVKDHTVLRNAGKIHYKLTVPTLDRIVVTGSGTVNHPDLKAPAITVKIDGSGDVVLRGTVDTQAVDISGSGNYTARDLATRTGEVTVDGSGDADVRVADSLKVRVSGSGNVTYHGSPSVQKDISGSGDVTHGQ
jgi:hypothetical protein